MDTEIRKMLIDIKQMLVGIDRRLQKLEGAAPTQHFSIGATSEISSLLSESVADNLDLSITNAKKNIYLKVLEQYSC